MQILKTQVRFVDRKFCYQVLDKKMELYELDSKRLRFNPVKTLYFSENWPGNVES